MKKIFITIFSIVLVVNISKSQNWIELGTIGNSLDVTQSINSIIVDSVGNIYTAVYTNVYKWNGVTWSILGSGTTGLNANGIINTIAMDKSGNIYASGNFTNTKNSAYVAKWNGINWSKVGIDSGNTFGISSMVIDNNDNIYIATNSIKKWDGNRWIIIDSYGSASNLVVDKSGNLYYGSDLDSNNAYYGTVIKWDGNKISHFGTVKVIGSINHIAINGSGNIFIWISNQVLKWNGNGWNQIGNNTGNITSIIIDHSNNIYVAGFFTDINGYHYVSKWNGSSWVELGTGITSLKANNSISTIALDDSGNVYAGGLFTNTDNYIYVAKWNGTLWSEPSCRINDLINGSINSIITDDSGNVYAGGGFLDINNNHYVGKWNDSIWSELGTGNNSLNSIPNDNLQQPYYYSGEILTIAKDNVGNIYAGGEFTDANGNFFVAKWNGATWSELGLNTNNLLNANNFINSIVTDNSGNVYATGQFTNSKGYYYVAKWDGISWSELGTLNANGIINTMTIDNSGNIYVAGEFNDNNGYYYVAKWNGSSWSELGSLNANDRINSIVADNLGNVYAGGNFLDNSYTYSYVAKWNGSSWIELGTGSNVLVANDVIRAIAIDKNGNIYAGGNFTNNNGYTYIAKWDGNTWNEIGSFNSISAITCIVSDKDNNIYASGGKDSYGYFYVAKCINNSTPTAITNQINTTNISVYPNPSTGQIHISATENGSLNIYNVLGELIVSKQVFKGTNDVDLSNQLTGMYTILFTNPNNTYTPVKLIKE